VGGLHPGAAVRSWLGRWLGLVDEGGGRVSWAGPAQALQADTEQHAGCYPRFILVGDLSGFYQGPSGHTGRARSLRQVVHTACTLTPLQPLMCTPGLTACCHRTQCCLAGAAAAAVRRLRVQLATATSPSPCWCTVMAAAPWLTGVKAAPYCRCGHSSNCQQAPTTTSASLTGRSTACPPVPLACSAEQVCSSRCSQAHLQLHDRVILWVVDPGCVLMLLSLLAHRCAVTARHANLWTSC